MHGSCHSSVHGQHHQSRCNEQHHHDCCDHDESPSERCQSTVPRVHDRVYYWPVAVCSVCRYPVDSCRCSSEEACCGEEHCGEYVPFVREIMATTAAPLAETIVGGEEPVAITLEFLADTGAEAAKVTLVITDGSGTTSVEEKDFGTEYQSLSGYVDLPPGTRMKLAVEQCTARVRWVEKVQ